MKQKILEVLKNHDSLCLDNEDEREILALILLNTIVDFYLDGDYNPLQRTDDVKIQRKASEE